MITLTHWTKRRRQITSLITFLLVARAPQYLERFGVRLRMSPCKRFMRTPLGPHFRLSLIGKLLNGRRCAAEPQQLYQNCWQYQGYAFLILGISCSNPGLKVVEALGLSFHTIKELNEKIDKELPASAHPPFQRKEVSFGGERLEFYSRDVMKCIGTLYGDPQFAQDLVFAPERHYTSQERTCRIYNEINTGDWWWTVQVKYTILQLKLTPNSLY